MKTNLQVSFFSVSTGIEINFNAFVTDFKDTYKMEWNSEYVFGRMDPIATYKNTQRSITCGFTMPAEDEEEAISIHDRFTSLLALTYPNFSVNAASGNATIASVPLFKVKYANHIMDANASVESQSAKDAGLLGYINEFKYEPNNDSNFFVKDGAIYRQSLNCTFNFTPLHTHRLGFIINEKTEGSTTTFKVSPAKATFPYGKNNSNILGG